MLNLSDLKEDAPLEDGEIAEDDEDEINEDELERALKTQQLFAKNCVDLNQEAGHDNVEVNIGRFLRKCFRNRTLEPIFLGEWIFIYPYRYCSQFEKFQLI